MLDNSFSKCYQIILLTKYLPVLKFSVSYPGFSWWDGGRRLCYIPAFQKHVRVEDVAAVSVQAVATAVYTNESLYVLGILLLYRI